MELTIQTLLNGAWTDAATLIIKDPKAGRSGGCLLDYTDPDYVGQHLCSDGLAAASMNYPVEFITYRKNSWFSFLDDIIPSGASRRYWVSRLGISNLGALEQDAKLLSAGAIAPVGNLRIKEAVEAVETMPEGYVAHNYRFHISDVADRDGDFLEYAQAIGAASGGATGAGGEAPKLLVRMDNDNQVWIDTFQDDQDNLDRHYLIKFPRSDRKTIDCNILRAEFAYYHELNEMGIQTISTDGMKLIEGEHYPSLWLPRFDVSVVDGKLVRHGLESLYSMLGAAAGTSLKHTDCISEMNKKLGGQQAVSTSKSTHDQSMFICEWIKRDFLNVCFGNSDNHGRNTSFIKSATGIELCPVYDFAPMRADPEGITRTITWGHDFEFAGNFKWIEIAKSFESIIDSEFLISELRALASKLIGLSDRLEAKGVSHDILNMPAVGLNYLDSNLKKWGLV